MPCTVESASLEPKYGMKFIAGGEDMWIHVFDFHTGDEIGMNPYHSFIFLFAKNILFRELLKKAFIFNYRCSM